ncbi:hypothetical protein HYH03_004151 [Edaphochlamys debaryana]|uniref:Chlorophyll a-b binding protein, chloroplastic n=1 Tax=Edaphochlamys debaryana TaxID=47281 RepID=A0A835YFP3_9CHLO|nr:hypothetical protein HYH03_004151 [Edaphochlamys debaryana]|eukprot:KAG2497885.1 hypothetical protein HYH03_004151 [Edaphochlamys debaryana]
MAAIMKSTRPAVSSRAGRRSAVVCRAERATWFPGVIPPSHLTGKLAGDRGFDPLCLGADPKALEWYKAAELVHCRWAMLGAAGVLVQEIVKPDVYFYEAGLPQNLPEPFKGINMGGLLAFEFCMMHFVEVNRYMDIKNHGSVNEDPVFKGNKFSNPEPGYPGFDPLGFAKGDFSEWKVKEIKNGRLAMIAFMSFVVQAQATGKGPIANLVDHLSNPFGNNILKNIGTCTVPHSVDVQGLTIPLTCLWPGN